MVGETGFILNNEINDFSFMTKRDRVELYSLDIKNFMIMFFEKYPDIG
jgi:gamma-glutamyltranspeptidase